jgi:hypothetical protein
MIQETLSKLFVEPSWYDPSYPLSPPSSVFLKALGMYVYVYKGWSTKSSPCTATFNDLCASVNEPFINPTPRMKCMTFLENFLTSLFFSRFNSEIYLIEWNDVPQSFYCGIEQRMEGGVVSSYATTTLSPEKKENMPLWYGKIIMNDT